MKRILIAVSSVMLLLCLNAFQSFAVDDIQEETATEDITASEEQTEATEPIITEVPTDIPDDSDEEPDDFVEPTTEYIPVEDIELSEYNYEMYVEDVQNLSATVLPQNATKQTVEYSSTNTDVATINKLGKLTAVGKGSCQICVSCDGLSVYYDLNVKVKTETIDVKSKFIVIKPDQKYNLEASVKPAGASQKLKYKSGDETVATVSSDGIVQAKSVGNTSIIISNEDVTIMVNVVVSAENSDVGIDDASDNYNDKNSAVIDNIVKQIREADSNVVTLKNVDTLTTAALKEIYGTEKKIVIECDEYDISIRGQDIFNAQNELNTKFNFTSTEKGLILTLDNECNLPGTINVKLKNCSEKYKYFYLLDYNTNEYKKINSFSNNEFKINSYGEYLLSTKEINKFRINVFWILGGVGVILIMFIIYIFSKKKYWFW